MEVEMCFLDPYGTSSVVQTKRAIVALVPPTHTISLDLWRSACSENGQHIDSLPLARELSFPRTCLESQELLEGDDGELLELVLSVRTLSVWWPGLSR
jgi:hypothetical protein